MTELDDIVQRARANHHDLNQTRAERKLRRHVFVFLKEADDGAASTATAERAIFRVPAHMTNGIELISVHYTPDAAVTADAANNATITFGKRDGAGGARTSLATYTSDVAGGSLVAHTPKALTNAAGAGTSTMQMAAGFVITEEITKAGTGVALQAGCFSVVYDEL